MALFDDLSDGVKKVFLAGVGAVAIGAEKSQELVEEVVRRGELTVDIYYGNGNEVCRELTYDIKTGKLVSSEEW